MDILMPQLGETVAEGTITAWHKAVGEQVGAGDVLFDIETDKSAMEVPSTQGGILAEIRVPAGATVAVGTVVAVVSAAAAADPPRPVRAPSRNYGPAVLPGGVKVTPAARRLAAESGVDLQALRGSGPHGHITAQDVQRAAAARTRNAVEPVAAGARAQDTAPRTEGAAAARVVHGEPDLSRAVRSAYANVAYEEVPLDAMRRSIARRLLEAKLTVPHFYLNSEALVDPLLQLRSDVNGALSSSPKLSVNDFIIRAAALALQRVPEANAAWAGDALLRFRQADVAVAVAVDGGLYTPVIRQAEAKSLRVLSAEMKQLAERARAHTLTPDEYRGGAITVSNLGMHRVHSFAAIVNPPQASILAVGAAERRALEGPEGVRFGTVMSLTLSCDHRVIDGVTGARLLAAIKSLLEAPLLLLT